MGPDPASSAVAKGTPTAPLPQAAVCATKVNRGSSGLLTGRPPTIIAWAISRPLTTVNSGQSGTPPDNGSASSAPSTGIPYAPPPPANWVVIKDWDGFRALAGEAGELADLNTDQPRRPLDPTMAFPTSMPCSPIVTLFSVFA